MAHSQVTIEGLDALLRRLRAFPAEMSKRGGPVRQGVQKGAAVIRDEAKNNIRGIVADPNIGGHDRSTGLLEKSVKAMRARNSAKYKGETYFVTIPKSARYPVDSRTPSGVGVATVGKMLEYGTAKQSRKPWMAPAFHSKKDEAVRVMVETVLRGVERVERKLALTVR